MCNHTYGQQKKICRWRPQADLLKAEKWRLQR